MIKIGNLVKIKGLAASIDEEKEVIPIGTICKVIGVYEDEKVGVLVGVVPQNKTYLGYNEVWYFEKDLEKGHMEWIAD